MSLDKVSSTETCRTVTFEGITLYGFIVHERGPLRFMPTITHHFAATDFDTARKWEMLIREHAIAYNGWHSLRKLDKTVPKSPKDHIPRKSQSYIL